MDEYTQDFIEEVSELIDDLESSLVRLEKDQTNKELITKIFRAMHTLKGASGMFGFKVISDFTHNLETIYELLRDDQISITVNLINITLSSVDHIKALLADASLEIQENKLRHQKLMDDISSIADEMGLTEILKTADIEQNNANAEIQEEFAKQKTYYIEFESPEDVNILFLFGELHNLGYCEVIPFFDKIPKLLHFSANKGYIYWKIFLVTEVPESEISDIFIFVENPNVSISRIAEYNIFSKPEFTDLLDESLRKGTVVELSALQKLGGVFNETCEKTTKTGKTEKKNPQKQDEIQIEEVTEEYIIPKNIEEENLRKKQASSAEYAGIGKIASIRVASDKLDGIMNLVSELITAQARLNLVAEQNPIPALSAVTRSIQKLTRELRDKSFSLSMLPISSMLTRFQRLIRDLSNKFDKKIEFITEGTETELDKTLLQNLSEPIMHLFRNCIDHGIESTEKRKELGKPEHGKIIFRAFYSGAHVVIQIIDDGAGINHEKIKEKAIKKRLINPNAIFSKKDMLNMIFLPGLSTAQKLTDISGRGVGMDVVKRKIEEVRGEVEVNSEKDKGTTFTIKLPLTLSIIDGLLVSIGKTKFIIQLSAVQKIYRVKQQQLNEYNNLIALEGKQVPFHFLRKEFEIKGETPNKMKLIVVAYENREIGLVVDDVVGEYQAVLKPLGKLYEHVEMISGGTILGDGSIALIMDTGKIIKTFAHEI
ncbi:MAG: hypothetical protein CSA05_00235 [Bacteroidia bacterium]|nr:MAG: hypothetical protein CSA05_00235 [Bacteroidia bacterium]